MKKSGIIRYLTLAHILREYVIKAELTDEQKERVDYWASNRGNNLDFSNSVMGGKDRLVLEDSLDKPVTPNPDVKAILEANGYDITDYRKGLALDKHDREVKIGKILNKLKATDELKKFESDPNRKAGTHSQLKVVITKNPYDVAGMSTDRGWTSCMNLDGGDYNNHVPYDVSLGTHIAYLVKGDDTEVKNPVGRIALKPYKDEKTGDTILIPEPRVYGSAPEGFKNIVKNWASKSFPAKDDRRYERNPDLYDDGSPDVIMSQASINKMVDEATNSDTLTEAWDLSVNKDIDTLNRMYDKAKSLGEVHADSFASNTHVPLELIFNGFNKIPEPILCNNVRSIPKAEASLMLYDDSRSDYLKFNILYKNHAYSEALEHFFNKCVDERKFAVKEGKSRTIGLSAPAGLPLNAIKRFMDLSQEELEGINPNVVSRLFNSGLHRMVADNDIESLKYLNKIEKAGIDVANGLRDRLQYMLNDRSVDGRKIASNILSRISPESIDTYELRNMLRSDDKDFRDAINKIAAKVFVSALENKDDPRRLVRSESLIHSMSVKGIEEISRLLKGKDEKEIRKAWNIINKEDKHKWNSALLKHMHPENHAKYHEGLRDKIHKERNLPSLREMAYDIPEELEKVLSDRIRYVEKAIKEDPEWSHRHETTASVMYEVKAELTPSQKKKVLKWYEGRKGSADFSDKAMDRKYRHILEDEVSKPVVINREVKTYLEGQGVTIKDYLKGIGVDKHGRDVKLGKILKRGPESILKTFENDPNRKSANSNKLRVVITKNPYDVAGMSTDRGWTSCMNLEDGMYRDTVPNDVKLGTHIAYLVQDHDTDIEHPVARIALKPMKSGNETILVPENKVYGTAPDSFQEIVNKWVGENFPPKEGKIYKMSSRLYDDGNGGVKATPNTIKKKIGSPKISNMEAKDLWAASPKDLDTFNLYCDRPNCNPEELLDIKFVENNFDALKGVTKVYALRYLTSDRNYAIMSDTKNPFWLRAEAAKRCGPPDTKEEAHAANVFIRDAIQNPTYEVEGNAGYVQKSLSELQLLGGRDELGAERRVNMILKAKLPEDLLGDTVSSAARGSLRILGNIRRDADILSEAKKEELSSKNWKILKLISNNYPDGYAKALQPRAIDRLDDEQAVKALKLDTNNMAVAAMASCLFRENNRLYKLAKSKIKKAVMKDDTRYEVYRYFSSLPDDIKNYVIDNVPSEEYGDKHLRHKLLGDTKHIDRYNKVIAKRKGETEHKKSNKHDNFKAWVHETRRLKDLLDAVGSAPSEKLEEVLKDRIRYVMKRKSEVPGWEHKDGLE